MSLAREKEHEAEIGRKCMFRRSYRVSFFGDVDILFLNFLLAGYAVVNKKYTDLAEWIDILVIRERTCLATEQRLKIAYRGYQLWNSNTANNVQ